MKTVLHGGRFWPLQRTDIPGVLHIYAPQTAIALRLLAGSALTSGLNLRPTAAAAAALEGVWFIRLRPLVYGG